jgi:hypothetical protein
LWTHAQMTGVQDETMSPLKGEERRTWEVERLDGGNKWTGTGRSAVTLNSLSLCAEQPRGKNWASTEIKCGHTKRWKNVGMRIVLYSTQHTYIQQPEVGKEVLVVAHTFIALLFVCRHSDATILEWSNSFVLCTWFVRNLYVVCTWFVRCLYVFIVQNMNFTKQEISKAYWVDIVFVRMMKSTFGAISMQYVFNFFQVHALRLARVADAYRKHSSLHEQKFQSFHVFRVKRSSTVLFWPLRIHYFIADEVISVPTNQLCTPLCHCHHWD